MFSTIFSSLYFPYSIIFSLSLSTVVLSSLLWCGSFPQGAVRNSMNYQKLTVLPGPCLFQHGLSSCCNFFELTSSYSSWHVAVHGLWMDVFSTVDLHGLRKLSLHHHDLLHSSALAAEAPPFPLLHWWWCLQACSSYIFSLLFTRSCCTAIFTLS